MEGSHVQIPEQERGRKREADGDEGVIKRCKK